MDLKTSVIVGGPNGDAKLESDNHMMEASDTAPKVRKPYTITKQREKWTEEEHQKFLKALKLYGRCWRQIEEHKLESGSKDTTCTKEAAAGVTASKSFKLFGRTVLLSESPSEAEYSQTLKTDQGLVLTFSSEQVDTNFSLGGVVSNWNQFEKQKESSKTETSSSPMLWWVLYQVPFHYLKDYSQTLDQTRNSCVEHREDDKEIWRERSYTDSSNGSDSGVETLGDRNLEAVDFFSQEPCTKGSLEPSNSRKGFVPYKRYLAERENASAVVVSNDRERQKIRVG